MKLAYIAQGKLYYRDSEGSAERSAPRQIDSPYAQDIVNRAIQREQKHSWKTGGTSAAAMMARQSMVMGGDPRALPVNITAVAPGATADELVYMVTTDAVGGLFGYDLKTNSEKRIFHKEHLFLSDFAFNRSRDVIACSQRLNNFTSVIALRQGNDVSQVTEGDTVDEAPSWVENNDKQLIYQSAGIARNQSGVMLGLGPTSIQRLDMGTGTVTPLLESDSHDYLCPRLRANGDLLFIRRPYEPPFKRNYPWHKMLIDTLLFPFRLLRAIFDFLNIFSMTFSRKPLTTAGGPKIEGPDEKSLFLRGRLIEAQQAMKDGAPEDAALYLVPRTWQLIRRAANGTETTIADGVLAFDVASDGRITYSTGAAVFSCAADGSSRQLISKDKFVDTLLVIE